MWAAAGTSMMPQMTFADVTRAIVIGVDGDAAGSAAATKAAEAYTEAGLTVRIIRANSAAQLFALDCILGITQRFTSIWAAPQQFARDTGRNRNWVWCRFFAHPPYLAGME
ncbi:toprim domain-containing protein [Sphingomonas paucimobilis]|uniref:toprim domain-containing protein n=1 Tax=Sphingomonas paucimobilis TaxID=13689 RepID=UPI001E3144BF|nr:toprim domain-containing protein [Sphingomonas paucimobilis]MCM3678339.1 toprim domain-containing protein [Sphingomonas paucimobilis]